MRKKAIPARRIPNPVKERGWAPEREKNGVVVYANSRSSIQAMRSARTSAWLVSLKTSWRAPG